MANELERLRAAALDPNFSDPAVYGPQQRPQTSILDMLRSRMASEMENEQAQRMSDLGNALLASRSRSLFGALGEGFRAQDEGSRARLDRLRQLAETERQQRALENQEASQRAEAEYRQQRLEAEAPERAARAGYYTARSQMDAQSIATMRAENAARNAASADAARAVQAEATRRSRAVPPLPALTEAEAATIRSTTFLQGMRERGFAPPAGAAAPSVTPAPAAPAAVIDLRRNPGGTAP